MHIGDRIRRRRSRALPVRAAKSHPAAVASCRDHLGMTWYRLSLTERLLRTSQWRACAGPSLNGERPTVDVYVHLCPRSALPPTILRGLPTSPSAPQAHIQLFTLFHASTRQARPLILLPFGAVDERTAVDPQLQSFSWSVHAQQKRAKVREFHSPRVKQLAATGPRWRRMNASEIAHKPHAALRATPGKEVQATGWPAANRSRASKTTGRHRKKKDRCTPEGLPTHLSKSGASPSSPKRAPTGTHPPPSQP